MLDCHIPFAAAHIVYSFFLHRNSSEIKCLPIHALNSEIWFYCTPGQDLSLIHILKFSELQLLDGDDRPFGNIYGATSSAVLTEFLSPQEIIDLSEEELLAFLAEKSRNRISDISRTSELLRKAARDSYRLDKCMYEPLNVSLASSFNCIQAYQKEIKLIEQAIEKCINGMNPNAFLILKSIPGIGPIWACLLYTSRCV